MQVKEIIKAIEEVAPLHFQESYDNSGLQVGDIENNITGAIITLDVTEKVIDEAIEKSCNLIIAHHPLLFRGTKQLSPATEQSRCIIKAIKHDISIYSSHTCMDKAPQGVSARTAEKLGIQIEKPLVPECSDSTFGFGIIGELKEETECETFLKHVKETLHLGCIRHTTPLGKKIKRVALCGGSAIDLLPDAIAQKADIYLTGDIKYHQFFDTDNQIVIADIGHFESEQFTKEIFYEIVSKNNAKFATYFSDTNPINYL